MFESNVTEIDTTYPSVGSAHNAPPSSAAEGGRFDGLVTCMHFQFDWLSKELTYSLYYQDQTGVY